MKVVCFKLSILKNFVAPSDITKVLVTRQALLSTHSRCYAQIWFADNPIVRETGS